VGGPKRLLGELPQSGQERADSGQRLAVLLAHPLRLVAPRDEVGDSVSVEVPPGGAEDEGANRALGSRLPELVRKAGELAQLENSSPEIGGTRKRSELVAPTAYAEALTSSSPRSMQASTTAAPSRFREMSRRPRSTPLNLKREPVPVCVTVDSYPVVRRKAGDRPPAGVSAAPLGRLISREQVSA
jgi:hypothetical protein